MIICHFNTINTVESRYSQTCMESGHTQRNFGYATLICTLFEKAFIPAWTLEGTESILGKYWKLKCMNKPRIQKREETKRSPVKEKVHILRCLQSLVTTSLSKPYWKHQSEPTGGTEARRKREAKAQAAKRQAESTQPQT